MKTIILELREIKENAEAVIFSVESLLEFINQSEPQAPLLCHEETADLPMSQQSNQ